MSLRGIYLWALASCMFKEWIGCGRCLPENWQGEEDRGNLMPLFSLTLSVFRLELLLLYRFLHEFY